MPSQSTFHSKIEEPFEMPFHILKLEIVSCPDRAHKNEKQTTPANSQVVCTAFGMPKIWPKNLLALVFLFPLELNVPQICSYQYEYWKVEAFCWENLSIIYPSQFYHCQDTSRSKCILGSRSESKRKQVPHVATQTVTCISYILIQCTGKHQSWLVWYLSNMHNNVMFDLCCQAYDLKASKIGGIDVGHFIYINPSSFSTFSPHFSDQWVGRCENKWVQHPAAQGSTTELK